MFKILLHLSNTDIAALVAKPLNKGIAFVGTIYNYRSEIIGAAMVIPGHNARYSRKSDYRSGVSTRLKRILQGHQQPLQLHRRLE